MSVARRTNVESSPSFSPAELSSVIGDRREEEEKGNEFFSMCPKWVSLLTNILPTGLDCFFRSTFKENIFIFFQVPRTDKNSRSIEAIALWIVEALFPRSYPVKHSLSILVIFRTLSTSFYAIPQDWFLMTVVI